jgi:two-component sensor histidine kinase
MTKQGVPKRPYRSLALAATIAWTVGAAVSFNWNMDNHGQTLTSLARTAARTALEKDIVYRSWSASYGGVYVPVTERSQPNPHLEGHPARDLVTSDGQRLTLINPSYMNRQVHEIEKLKSGARGHLTSLDPIRPGNSPDRWETEALKRIANGSEEESALEKFDGAEHMRLMRPVVAEEACLGCHEKHGYQLGEVRGGLSVAIPMAPIRAAGQDAYLAIILWHTITWTLGLIGIILGANRLSRYYSEQEKAEAQILASLQDKEILLREIHHRVKNNLQVVSGMLDLQAVVVGDEKARMALKESRNRIMTMALIHQRLYQTESLADIDMKEYISRLAADLFTAYSMDSDNVALTVEAAAVRLNINTAIPIGLIVNELLVNSMKYAFPATWFDGAGKGKKGHISVVFRPLQEERFVLEVTDNGIGLPEAFDPGKSSSLGLKLVHSLVEQLDGTITAVAGAGARYIIQCSIIKETETRFF